MTRVTRDVEFNDLIDLLKHVSRAAITLEFNGAPVTSPVVLIWSEEHIVIGVAAEADQLPSPSQEVVLLIDDGVYWFDLRAVYLRGRIEVAEPPLGASPGLAWFELMPTKMVAWD